LEYGLFGSIRAYLDVLRHRPANPVGRSYCSLTGGGGGNIFPADIPTVVARAKARSVSAFPRGRAIEFNQRTGVSLRSLRAVI